MTNRLFLSIDRAIRAMCDFALWIACAVILLIAFLGATDIVSTTALHKPIPSVLELSETGHALIIFLGFASVQRTRSHITVDIFTNMMGPRLRAVAHMTALFAGFALMGYLAWQSFDLFASSWKVAEISPGYLAYPVYPAKLLVFLGLTIATLEFARQIVRFLIGLDGIEPEQSSSAQNKI